MERISDQFTFKPLMQFNRIYKPLYPDTQNKVLSQLARNKNVVCPFLLIENTAILLGCVSMRCVASD